MAGWPLAVRPMRNRKLPLLAPAQIKGVVLGPPNHSRSRIERQVEENENDYEEREREGRANMQDSDRQDYIALCRNPGGPTRIVLVPLSLYLSLFEKSRNDGSSFVAARAHPMNTSPHPAVTRAPRPRHARDISRRPTSLSDEPSPRPRSSHPNPRHTKD